MFCIYYQFLHPNQMMQAGPVLKMNVLIDFLYFLSEEP